MFQFGPDLHLFEPSPEELEARRQEQLRQQEQEQDDRASSSSSRRVDLEALKPPPRAQRSDADRQAQARERAAEATESAAVLARKLGRAG